MLKSLTMLLLSMLEANAHENVLKKLLQFNKQILNTESREKAGKHYTYLLIIVNYLRKFMQIN